MKKKTTTKHPDAIAWDEFLASERGARCTQPLGLPNQRTYMENRLFWAFRAGIEHGRSTPQPKRK